MKWALIFIAAFSAHSANASFGADDIQQLAQLVRWSGVLLSLLVIAGTWLALRFVRSVVDSISKQFVHYRMLAQKLHSFFQFFAYLAAGSIVFLLSFRVNEQMLTIIGGTVAVAVGFAVKDLAASFIAGLTIMIDRPFQVGDRVTFDGCYGDVIAIGLRSVRVQTLNDDVVTIPNNRFLNEVTVSGNYGALDMQVVLPFYIAIDQDIDLARDIIQEAASSSRYVHLPKPVTVLVSQQIADNYFAIRLTCKAYVVDTQYEKLFETDITLRVMHEFKKRGIAPPTIAMSAQVTGNSSLQNTP